MITLINKERKAGIENFLKPLQRVGEFKKLQISAFQIDPSSDSTYWDDTEFIDIVRSGNLYKINPSDFELYMFQGQISFLDVNEIPVATVGLPYEHTAKIQTSNQGFWCVIIRDVTKDIVIDNEIIESLFRVHVDNFSVKKHLFTYLFEYTSTFEKGELYGKLKFDAVHIHVRSVTLPNRNAMTIIYLTHEKINQLPENVSNKVKLSLTWFNKTLNARSYDRFLFCWIALEILTMKNESDVKTLKRILGKAYSLDNSQVEPTFGVGKLYGLRSKIVHEGYTPSLSLDFLHYCELLYIDIFNEVMENSQKKLALQHLENKDMNLSDYLKDLFNVIK